jgi:hypothetical protein
VADLVRKKYQLHTKFSTPIGITSTRPVDHQGNGCLSSQAIPHTFWNESFTVAIVLKKTLYMKKFTIPMLVLCLLIIGTKSFSQSCACSTGNCDFTITPSMSDVDFTAADLKAAMGVTSLAGKRICIQAGTYTNKRITIRGAEGTLTSPIIVKNCGGLVVINNTAGGAIALWDTQYVRLLGNSCIAAPDEIQYGIRAKSSGNYVEAKAITGRITDIEIAWLNVGGDSGTPGSAGIKIIDEPGCDADTIKNRNSAQRWVMRNIKVHDNYIHNTGTEGMYIGKGDGWYGNGLTGKCADPNRKSYSVSIKGVRLYNNKIENTGWDGLQLKDGDSDVKIYNNDITNYGLLNNGSQNEGMMLGAGDVGDVYHNRIINGTGHGVMYQGLGNFNFHNNIVVNNADDGIYFNGTFTEFNDPNAYIRIINNTIVKTPQSAVYFQNYNTVGQRVLLNNILAESGATNVITEYTTFTTKADNLTNTNADDLDFAQYEESSQQDYLTNDYHILASSPAVDEGTNAGSYSADSIAFDFDGTARGYGAGWDIGAFEYDNVIDPPDTTEWALFIDAGGGGYNESEGGEIIEWEGDTPHSTFDTSFPTYTTGSQSAFSGSNNTTAPNQVIGTYRYTNNTGTTIRYNIPVPVSGAIYDIDLFFARKTADTFTSGARRFNILVEGQNVTTYDVYDQGGAGGTAASSYSYSTAVHDGSLELIFQAVTGAHAQINAISVKKQAGPDPDPTESLTLFINSGGDEFIQDENITWEDDKTHPTLDNSFLTYATGGENSFFGANGTSAPDEVLGSSRYTMNSGTTIRYNIPVPAAGDYDVELFFARKSGETYTSGARRFNVIIEGVTVASAYDVYDQGGAGGTGASSLTHTATVNDDFLEVKFVAVTGAHAMINAIKVDGPVESGSLMAQSAQAEETPQPEAQQVESFAVFPNPAADYIDIRFADEDVYTIKIVSPRNEVYATSTLDVKESGTAERLDISQLPQNQLFIVHIQSSRDIRTFKVFKSK